MARRPNKRQRAAAAAARQRRIPPPGSLARINAERIAAANAPQAGGLPFSMEDLAAQAAAMARSQVSSQEASLQGQLGQLGSQGERLAGVASGAYAGLGRLLGNIGPQIADVYNQAATSQMQAGQGFSDAFQAQAQADAAADAAFLQGQGAPQAQQDLLTGAPTGSDVLYGTGGYIPSSSMGREGAAWGAYGATLPAASARMGQMEVADILRANAESAGPIRAELASLQASFPGLQAQIQNELFGQRLDAWQAQDQSKLNWAAYNLTAKELGIKTKAEKNELKANQGQQQFENAIALGLDPRTGQPLPEGPAKINTTASKANGYQTDDFGRPILDANGKRIPYKDKSDSGGGTKADWAGINTDASSLARKLYDETTKVTETVNPETGREYLIPKETETRRTRAQAFATLWNEFYNLIPNTAAAKAKLRRFINRNLTVAGWPKPPPRPKTTNSTRVPGQPVG